MISNDIISKIIEAQRNEITEYFIYRNFAKKIKDENNREIIEKIANEELKHYEFWKKFTQKDVQPSKFKILFYSFLLRVFGVVFTARLLEKGERYAQQLYEKLKDVDLETATFIIEEEKRHEDEILSLIKEKHLEYSGSFVLGLSDAIIELSGVLIGLTFALQNTRLIAIIGIITGIAASLSMGVSEFLSTKEEGEKHPLTAGIFTGIAYVVTVLIMVLPYFIFTNYFAALVLSLILAIVIIMLFNFYITVMKNVEFKKRFSLMLLIITGVAIFNLIIGNLMRIIFKVEV